MAIIESNLNLTDDVLSISNNQTKILAQNIYRISGKFSESLSLGLTSRSSREKIILIRIK